MRTIFIVVSSIAALLFEELNNRIEILSKESLVSLGWIRQQELSDRLEDWKNQYDLVCRFVEQSNRCFGFLLLMITGNDFATCIFEFNNILENLDLKGSIIYIVRDKRFYRAMDVVYDSGSLVHMRSDPIKTCQFLHPILRFLIILVVAHSVGKNVFIFTK